MKCILHIGTEKTATKTIQHFMNLNRKKILESGAVFTQSAGTVNNIKLPLAAYNLFRRDELTSIYGINPIISRLKFRKEVRRKLAKELNQNPDFPVIFSSEHIQSRLVSRKELVRLKRLLESLDLQEITIIVYLRNPAELANSLFSTAVKYGEEQAAPPPPSQAYFHNVCNHKKTLKKFRAAFPQAAVLPCLFIRDEFKNNSILADFCCHAGLPWREDYLIPEDKMKVYRPLESN